MKIASAMHADGKLPNDRSTGKESTGTLFVHNVYEGMTGVEPGRVKYLRVVGPLSQPWGVNPVNQIGMNVDVHRKRIYGVVKVQDDGSAYFKVPANENILFQALDENFMAMQLLKGHQKVKLTHGEFLNIVTWIDANAPYSGAYTLMKPPKSPPLVVSTP